MLWAEGSISGAEWTAARNSLEGTLAGLRAETVQAVDREVLTGLAGAGGELRREWPTMSFGQRRAVVEAVVESVTLNPATGPRNRFDTSRIVISWA